MTNERQKARFDNNDEQERKKNSEMKNKKHHRERKKNKKDQKTESENAQPVEQNMTSTDSKEVTESTDDQGNINETNNSKTNTKKLINELMESFHHSSYNNFLSYLKNNYTFYELPHYQNINLMPNLIKNINQYTDHAHREISFFFAEFCYDTNQLIQHISYLRNVSFVEGGRFKDPVLQDVIQLNDIVLYLNRRSNGHSSRLLSRAEALSQKLLHHVEKKVSHEPLTPVGATPEGKSAQIQRKSVPQTSPSICADEVKDLDYYKSENAKLTESVKKMKSFFTKATSDINYQKSQVAYYKPFEEECANIKKSTESKILCLKQQIDETKKEAERYKQELDQSVKKYDEFKEKSESEITELSKKVELLNEERNLIQKEFNDYQSKMSFKPILTDRNRTDEIAEKQRLLVSIKESNDKYENACEKVKILEEENSKLKSEMVSKDILMANIKSEAEAQKNNLKKRLSSVETDYENQLRIKTNQIEELSLNIKNLSMEKESSQSMNNNTSDTIAANITKSHNHEAESSRQDTSALPTHQTTDHSNEESVLEKILEGGTEKAESVVEAIDEGITSVIIDTECENNLLLEQTELLKQEIRRLDRLAKREENNIDTENVKKALIKFILSDAEEKKLILPYLVSFLQPNEQEAKKLNEFARGEETEQGYVFGSFSKLAGYVNKLI